MPTVILQRRLSPGVDLVLAEGDLTEARVDAIVNAANPELRHGGGLAAAIVRRGGPTIQEESDAWVRRHGPAGFDRPAVTGGGALPARTVIHAVGPVWGEGDEDDKLRRAVWSSLATASDLRLSSIGLPAIATGIYGFPIDRAAPVILDAITDFVAANPNGSLRRIEIVLFDRRVAAAFEAALSASPPLPDGDDT